MSTKIVVGPDGQQTQVPTTPADDAQAAQDAIDNASAATAAAIVQQRISAFKGDANYQAMLTQLKSATPAQVTTFITNSVTDLPSARAMLTKLALVLALVANGS